MNEDEPFAHRLRAGEREAFTLAVDRHYASVFRQLSYLAGSDDLAADLTQETFVEAWKSLRTFRGQSSLRTWLHTIAVRVWWRRAARGDRDSVLEIHESLVSDAPEPEDAALAALEWEAVACAVRRLPDAPRAVVVLSYLEQMTHAEIAAALGIPVGTVKSRLHDALRRLRRSLAHGEGEPYAKR